MRRTKAQRLVEKAGLTAEDKAALRATYRGGNGPAIAFAREGLIRIFGPEVVGDTHAAVIAFLGSGQCPRRVMNVFVTLRGEYGYDPALQV